MARSPHVPDLFDVCTVVILRRPDDAPEMSEEALDALQEEHLAYRAELVRQGVLVANGPFLEQSDETHRGMSIFACDLATAARLSDDDPSVRAGGHPPLHDVVREPAGTLAFPKAQGPVGDQRPMPDD